MQFICIALFQQQSNPKCFTWLNVNKQQTSKNIALQTEKKVMTIWKPDCSLWCSGRCRSKSALNKWYFFTDLIETNCFGIFTVFKSLFQVRIPPFIWWIKGNFPFLLFKPFSFLFGFILSGVQICVSCKTEIVMRVSHTKYIIDRCCWMEHTCLNPKVMDNTSLTSVNCTDLIVLCGWLRYAPSDNDCALLRLWSIDLK